MNKLEYVARSLSRGTKKIYETYVINAIYQKVNNPNLIIETQKSIKLNHVDYSPLIDLFMPQLNLAIEVDEYYHLGEEQQKFDIWREGSINTQIKESCDGASIQFERVKTANNSLEELNKRIDEIVEIINEKIQSRTESLVWKDQQEILEDIIRRGTIERDDCFDSNVQIINIVYGKNYKAWQKAGYKNLWFPVISDKDKDMNLSSRSSRQNFFNQTHNILYERSADEKKNSKKKKWSIYDKDKGTKRIVFVRDRDSFGKSRKRFAGVYKADGWDDNIKAEKWKLIATEIKIPIEKDF